MDLEIETQNPNGGQGFTILDSKMFNVLYPTLRVISKPIITELVEKSAVQIDWASLYLNPGIINGQFSYVNNFIKYGNIVLTLDVDSNLKYNTTVVSPDSTLSFMIKIDKTYNGIIYKTNDEKYQFGYNLSQQKFYTMINGTTNYSELIRITVNPFFITLLENRAVIRQYNICNEIRNMIDVKVSDIYDYPVAFMVQANN